MCTGLARKHEKGEQLGLREGLRLEKWFPARLMASVPSDSIARSLILFLPFPSDADTEHRSVSGTSLVEQGFLGPSTFTTS